MATQLGIGTLLQMGDGATPETFTTISDVRTITGPSMKTVVKDVTSLSSPGRTIQRRTTLIDPGDLKFKLSFDPNDPTHNYVTGLISKLTGLAPVNFKLVYDVSPPVTWLLNASVSDMGVTVPTDDVLMADVTLTSFKVISFTGT